MEGVTSSELGLYTKELEPAILTLEITSCYRVPDFQFCGNGRCKSWLLGNPWSGGTHPHVS